MVIGLEIHAQLATDSKIFASDSTQFGDSPNRNVSPITLGHPGTLPLLNKKVVEYAIKMGLACKSSISKYIIFDRKNYFYPDLPKGYQITQDNTPICLGGHITIDVDENELEVPLNRIHLEEDAGKSLHLEADDETLVDYNRAGVPLIEIVTEPAIKSATEARVVLAEVRKLVRHLGICDGNMEEGSLRCDVNISIKEEGNYKLGNKVEVKNLNSTRNVERAVQFEMERQIILKESGNTIVSETRTFDDDSGTTSSLRTKETLNDYRYFPDPDLSPVTISQDWINEVKSKMPALPRDIAAKIIQSYNLTKYNAQLLGDNKKLYEYFITASKFTKHHKSLANWILGPVKNAISENEQNHIKIKPNQLIDLIELVEQEKISYTAASQQLFPKLVETDNTSVAKLAEDMNLLQDSNTHNLEALIDSVLSEFPDKVTAYKNGKKGILGMFVGEVMKKSKGKANPRLLNELFNKKLR